MNTRPWISIRNEWRRISCRLEVMDFFRELGRLSSAQFYDPQTAARGRCKEEKKNTIRLFEPTQNVLIFTKLWAKQTMPTSVRVDVWIRLIFVRYVYNEHWTFSSLHDVPTRSYGSPVKKRNPPVRARLLILRQFYYYNFFSIPFYRLNLWFLQRCFFFLLFISVLTIRTFHDY